MAKKKGAPPKAKDYFGMSRIASFILALIPITSWILGFVTRFKEGKILAGIIRLFGGGFVLWIFDLILILVRGRILRLLPI